VGKGDGDEKQQKDTYINSHGSRVQVALKRLDISPLCLSVHRNRHDSPNVEPDLDEVWVLG
jgi:hypothetical protein